MDKCRRRFMTQIGCTSLLAASQRDVFADSPIESPYSSVPNEFREQLASLRSPLLFNDWNECAVASGLGAKTPRNTCKLERDRRALA